MKDKDVENNVTRDRVGKLATNPASNEQMLIITHVSSVHRNMLKESTHKNTFFARTCNEQKVPTYRKKWQKEARVRNHSKDIKDTNARWDSACIAVLLCIFDLTSKSDYMKVTDYLTGVDVKVVPNLQ